MVVKTCFSVLENRIFHHKHTQLDEHDILLSRRRGRLTHGHKHLDLCVQLLFYHFNVEMFLHKDNNVFVWTVFTENVNYARILHSSLPKSFPQTLVMGSSSFSGLCNFSFFNPISVLLVKLCKISSQMAIHD